MMKALNKDLDDYMSKRRQPPAPKKSLKELFMKEFGSRHVTLNNNQLENLSDETSNVVVIGKEPNFFKVLHDRIKNYFK